LKAAAGDSLRWRKRRAWRTVNDQAVARTPRQAFKQQAQANRQAARSLRAEHGGGGRASIVSSATMQRSPCGRWRCRSPGHARPAAVARSSGAQRTEHPSTTLPGPGRRCLEVESMRPHGCHRGDWGSCSSRLLIPGVAARGRRVVLVTSRRSIPQTLADAVRKQAIAVGGNTPTERCRS